MGCTRGEINMVEMDFNAEPALEAGAPEALKR